METGITTPRENSVSCRGRQLYVELIYISVTPSVMFPPLGRYRVATSDLDPFIPLCKQSHRKIYYCKSLKSNYCWCIKHFQIVFLLRICATLQSTIAEIFWVSLEFVVKATKNWKHQNNLFVIGIALWFGFTFRGFFFRLQRFSHGHCQGKWHSNSFLKQQVERRLT